MSDSREADRTEPETPDLASQRSKRLLSQFLALRTLTNRSLSAEGFCKTAVNSDGQREMTWLLPESATGDGPEIEHRIDGPAYVSVSGDGLETHEIWMQHGVTTRTDGPAVIRHSADGASVEQWYLDGRAHRTDGPATTERQADGTVEMQWFHDDQWHRKDGPAIVVDRPDGSRVEVYIDRNRVHRVGGPAMIVHHPDGTRTETMVEDDEPVVGADGSARRRIMADGTAVPSPIPEWLIEVRDHGLYVLHPVALDDPYLVHHETLYQLD